MQDSVYAPPISLVISGRGILISGGYSGYVRVTITKNDSSVAVWVNYTVDGSLPKCNSVVPKLTKPVFLLSSTAKVNIHMFGIATENTLIWLYL